MFSALCPHGVADQTGDQPAQGDMLPLRRLPQVIEEVFGQGYLKLRSCACADARCAISVAVSVMSPVHSLFLQQPDPRAPIQFEVPSPR
jgi:hypothetical protein